VKPAEQPGLVPLRQLDRSRSTAEHPLRASPALTDPRRLRSFFSTHAVSGVVSGIFSFEALFALFLYSNTLKYFFPQLPIDETLLLLLVSMSVFTYLVWWHGLHRPGLELVLLALIFFGWQTLSMLWSPGRTLALWTVGYNLTFNVFCLCVGALLFAADRRRIARFFAWVLAIATFLSLHGLWIYAQYGTFRFYRGFEDIHAYLLWGFPVATASAISLGFAFAAPPGTARQLVGTTLSILFAIFLLIASGRAPMLSYAVCLVIPMFLVGPRIVGGRLLVPRMQFIAGLSVLALTGYVFYAIRTGNIPDTIERFFALWWYVEHGGTSVRFQRLSYWLSALDYWSRSPWIGNGVGSFSSLYLAGYELAGTQPHNILLEIGTELGLVGLVLFGIVLWAALRTVRIERLKRDPLFLGSFLMFVGLFGVRAMTSTDLALQWELFVSLGLLTATSGTGNPDRPGAGALGKRGTEVGPGR
jgi:O-antigen ligase